ncbi:MAG: putative FKBP-type peptidyl-prolyl cis-trans isomerase, partial [Streblomastix strix]
MPIQKTVIKAGDPKIQPAPGKKVFVHYVGKLHGTDQVFDSSRKRRKPFSFTLGAGEVIAAWDQASHNLFTLERGVAQMNKGETCLLVCPPELAYGDRGVPGTIPPKATLDFEVELLDYEIIKLQFSEAFGRTLLMKLKGTQIKHIIKRLPYFDKDEKKIADQQIKILNQAQSAHIVRLIETFKHDLDICIVFEYCSDDKITESNKDKKDQTLNEYEKMTKDAEERARIAEQKMAELIKENEEKQKREELEKQKSSSSNVSQSRSKYVTKESLNQLTSMGFEKRKAETALNAAKGELNDALNQKKDLVKEDL